MNNLDELFKQATMFHQNNQFEYAEKSYKQILQQFPNHPDALNLLGVACSQQNKYDEGINYLKKAIEINKHPMYFNNIGECFRLKGLFSDAEYNFYQAISFAPNFAEAYFNLANVLKLQGKINQAIEYYNVTLEINPKHFRALFNIGNIMLEQNRFDEAINYYQKSIQINQGFSEAITNHNKAINLKQEEKNKFEQQINKYNQNLKINPDDYLSYKELGKLFCNKNMFNESLVNYQKSLNINQNQLDVYNDMALIFTKLNDFDNAIECYKKYIEIEPSNKLIYENIAYSFEKIGNIQEAKKYYYMLANFDSNKKLSEFLADTLDAPISYNKEEIIEYHKNLLQTLDKYIDIDLNIDFSTLHKTNLRIPLQMIYHGVDDTELRKKYARVFSKYCSENIFTKINNKPKLAFIVTRGHEGIFMTCMKGLINNLSNEKFDINIICSEESYREILKPNIKNPNINFISLPERIDLAVEKISKENIDLLYYWEIGTDTMNYFLPFFRLGKIQCTSWGWPVTSGIEQVDYYISSNLMLSDETQKEFSEKLAMTDSLLTYYYRTPLPKQFMPRSYFGFSETDKIYICTQNLRKIHPDFDKITLEILKKDPKAIYLLFEDHIPYVTNLLKKRLKESHGEYFKQIRFYPRIMRGPEYINLVKISDVMLDTLYFGGVNTTYDAFSVGLPIVTLPSQFQRGRYTYALYKIMGINDCIAENETDYIDLSIKIANDSNFKQQISKNILEKEYLLFKDSNVIRDMSNLFENILNKVF